MFRNAPVGGCREKAGKEGGGEQLSSPPRFCHVAGSGIVGFGSRPNGSGPQRNWCHSWHALDYTSIRSSRARVKSTMIKIASPLMESISEELPLPCDPRCFFWRFTQGLLSKRRSWVPANFLLFFQRCLLLLRVRVSSPRSGIRRRLPLLRDLQRPRAHHSVVSLLFVGILVAGF